MNEDFSQWLMKILASGLGEQAARNVHITINWVAPPVGPPQADEGPAGPGPRRPRQRKRPDKLTGADSGNTALHGAVLAGDETLVQKLIQENADVNAKNKAGLTPLHMAVNGRYQKIVKQLIEKGANLTATDNQGRNAFYVAQDEIKPDEKAGSSSSPAPVSVRKRREVVETGMPALHLAAGGKPQVASVRPQIGDMVSMPSMPNNSAVLNATVLLEMAARKLTGTKLAAPLKVPLAKDRMLNRRLDAIDEMLAAALSEYSNDASSSSIRFSNA